MRTDRKQNLISGRRAYFDTARVEYPFDSIRELCSCEFPSGARLELGFQGGLKVSAGPTRGGGEAARNPGWAYGKHLKATCPAPAILIRRIPALVFHTYADFTRKLSIQPRCKHGDTERSISS